MTPAAMLSTRDVAAAIGCHPTTVTRAAKRLALGRLIGSSLVFSAGDVAALRREIRDGPGNPQFGAAAARPARRRPFPGKR